MFKSSLIPLFVLLGSSIALANNPVVQTRSNNPVGVTIAMGHEVRHVQATIGNRASRAAHQQAAAVANHALRSMATQYLRNHR